MVKTLKGVWLPAVVAAAVAVALVATAASAAVSSLGIGSADTTPGGTVVVNVTAEATSPGIGAFTVDVSYDDSLVTLSDCTSVPGLCNPAYAAHTARLVGASASGLSGTVVLGTLTFQAGQTEGVADLNVSIAQLTDPESEAISVTAGNGAITIAVPPTPSPTPEPTVAPTAEPTAAPTAAPTATAAALPDTGGSPSDGSSTAAWLLAIVGLAVVSGGAWAVARTRR